MVIKVSLEEIRRVFDELIKEKRSREQVALWASLRQHAHDADNLEFEPPSEKKRIWRSILYLIGVDLIDLDKSYLHSIDNFIDFRREIGLEDSCDHHPQQSLRNITNKWVLGKELKLELEKGCDIVRISRWAFRILSEDPRLWDAKTQDILEALSSMEDDPQFELTKKGLFKLADKLILEGDKEELAEPISNIKEIAEDLGDSWLMCPLCQEAWENTLDYAMVRCPKCNNRLHNPKFK